MERESFSRDSEHAIFHALFEHLPGPCDCYLPGCLVPVTLKAPCCSKHLKIGIIGCKLTLAHSS